MVIAILLTYHLGLLDAVSAPDHQQNVEQQQQQQSIDVYDGILKPFLLILQEKKTQPTIISLELLSKLFEYNYWNMDIPGMKGLFFSLYMSSLTL